MLPLHIEKRVRCALLVKVGAFIGTKAHMFVEALCERILFIDGHFVYLMMLDTVEEETLAQTLSAVVGCKEQHLEFTAVDSHKGDSMAVIILGDDKM